MTKRTRPAYNASTNYKKGSTLEIIDVEDEFKPLDEGRIEFLIGLASDIKDIAERSSLTDIDKQIIELASHQMMVMTSMTLAGFDLYDQHMHHAVNLYDEARHLLNCIKAMAPESADLIQTPAMNEWEVFMTKVDTIYKAEHGG